MRDFKQQQRVVEEKLKLERKEKWKQQPVVQPQAAKLSSSTTSNVAPDNKKEALLHRNLYQEMSTMTELSALVYTVAYLLDSIGKGGYKPSWFAPRQALVQTDLVLSHNRFQPNLSATKMLAFVHANSDALSVNPEITGHAPPGTVHPKTELHIRALNNIQQHEADNYLWVLDHHFGEKDVYGNGIVYGITVNRALQRVTVVFRGSVTGEDWMQNLRLPMATLPTPTRLKQQLHFDQQANNNIKVHSGFKRYLLSDILEAEDRSDEDMPQVGYGRILLDLQACYQYKEKGEKVHQGFRLYVTGHSLGGALSTLLAMKLAASDWFQEHIHAPMPIVNLSFASPFVGNQAFANATRSLEQAGWLCHVRVSNQNDVVPAAPPSRLLYNMLYEPYIHTGINIHLHADTTPEIGYGVQRSFFSQFALLSSADRHQIVDHWVRQNNHQEHFKKESIATLYQNYARFDDTGGGGADASTGGGGGDWTEK